MIKEACGGCLFGFCHRLSFRCFVSCFNRSSFSCAVSFRKLLPVKRTGAHMEVSLIAVKAVHWFHVPNHVLTIPSVIPMIPGVLMYRALFGLINMHGVVGEVTAVVSNGITASLIILCIALGVAVPNIFARRYIAKDRQRFLQEELQKRRERGKFIEW